jgi:hypothetical protein
MYTFNIKYFYLNDYNYLGTSNPTWVGTSAKDVFNSDQVVREISEKILDFENLSEFAAGLPDSIFYTKNPNLGKF